METTINRIIFYPNVYKIKIRKTEVNINRQLTKYAMDTKDGKDSAALWEQIKNGIS